MKKYWDKIKILQKELMIMINQVVTMIKTLIKNYSSMKINKFFILKIFLKSNNI